MSRFSDPVIADIAASSYWDSIEHIAVAREDITGVTAEEVSGFALVDEAGIPVLYLSGRSFAYRQCARITFPDQRWLRFWVPGAHPGNAIMTAVDEAGIKVARYRRREFGRDWGTDIAVQSDRMLTEQLALAIAISVRWLFSYFERPARVDK